LDARPHGLQRDVRTTRVVDYWIVLVRHRRPFSSPVPSSLSTCYARIDFQFDAPIVMRGKRGI